MSERFIFKEDIRKGEAVVVIEPPSRDLSVTSEPASPDPKALRLYRRTMATDLRARGSVNAPE